MKQQATFSVAKIESETDEEYFLSDTFQFHFGDTKFIGNFEWLFSELGAWPREMTFFQATPCCGDETAKKSCKKCGKSFDPWQRHFSYIDGDFPSHEDRFREFVEQNFTRNEGVLEAIFKADAVFEEFKSWLEDYREIAHKKIKSYQS